MDNVTHSLIGAMVARTLEHKVSAARRPYLYAASVIANNAPDLDFVIPLFYKDRQLAYLIHHRGITHTVLAVVLIGVLLGWAFKKRFDVKERATLFLVCILGGFLHFGADFWNDYGVHPLTPFLGHWFYGGRIFIVEPLLWCAAIPFLWMKATAIFEKMVWAFALVGVAAFATRMEVGLGPILVGAVFFLFNFGFLRSVLGKAGAKRAVYGWGTFVGVLATFWSMGTLARARFSEQLPQGIRPLAMGSTPSPMNPFCWKIMSSGITGDPADAQGRFVVYQGWINFLAKSKELQPNCYFGQALGFVPQGRASLQASQSPDGTPLWSFSGTMSEFNTLKEKSCRFRSLLDFARFPFWATDPKGQVWAGDLRYDRAGRGGFATFETGAKQSEGSAASDQCRGLPSTGLISPSGL